MSSLILLLLAMAYWQWRQAQDATITLCPHCADLVQHAPGLPYACPSCGRWWIG